jgi:DNA polymerase III epsilon subunit-like protein
LGDKPLFAAVADDLLAFVGDAALVAHNADFDIAFLNAELKRAAEQPKLANSLPLAWRRLLAWHKRLSVYVAERYASKAYLSETKREILDSIRDLARRIEHP